MSNGDKFSERAKNQLLYEYQEGSDVGQMLDQSETNSRVNQEMAQRTLVGMYADRVWKGSYKNFFGELFIDMQRLYLNMDGYSRVQAIEMCQSKTVTEANLTAKQEKKRGGIFGLFG